MALGALASGVRIRASRPLRTAISHDNPNATSRAAEQVGQAFDKSRSENEARLERTMSLIEKFGGAATARADETTRNLQGSAMQGLLNRGLGNTTVLNNVHQGIARQGDLAKTEIDERRATMLANILQGVSSPYPDLGLYAQLLMQPGASRGL